MKEQGRKLMAMINAAVGGLTRLDELVPVVQGLGRRHATYGVKDGRGRSGLISCRGALAARRGHDADLLPVVGKLSGANARVAEAADALDVLRQLRRVCGVR
jgi:aspartate 1-decarboxylase